MEQGNDLQQRAQGILERAKAIILKPAETWPVIAGETDPPAKVFTSWVVPLVAIGPVASFIGGQIFGYGAFGFSYKPSLMNGLTSAVVQFVLGLVGVWVIAWVANFLSPKFGGKDDFPSAFRLVAYAMTAAWVVGIVGLIPALGILGLAGLYSFYLLYLGAKPVMTVPEDKAVGFTVVTVVATMALYFVVTMVSAAVVGTAAMAGLAAESEKASIDMGDLGNIQVDEDGTTATITVDGQEMKIEIPEEQQE